MPPMCYNRYGLCAKEALALENFRKFSATVHDFEEIGHSRTNHEVGASVDSRSAVKALGAFAGRRRILE